ncbi:MAG: hypothetical protein Q4F38_10150, partial [Akkermansia sp.]|nr:hypothetical protein [Akkermansia sp.]
HPPRIPIGCRHRSTGLHFYRGYTRSARSPPAYHLSPYRAFKFGGLRRVARHRRAAAAAI